MKLWFTRWFTEQQTAVNPVDVITADSIKLEAALTSEDVQISEKFRKTVLSQFQAEAQISEAQLNQALQLKTAVDRVDPTVLEQEDWVDSPFSTIVGEEEKLISKEKLVCTKCSIRGHTTKAHYGLVTKKISTNLLEPAEESSSVFTCSPGDAATSFLDGTVNIGQTVLFIVQEYL